MVWYKNYECLQRDVFPLEQQEDFFLKKIYLSVIQKYVMHTWAICLFYQFLEQFFKNIQKFGSFCVFQEIFRTAFRTNIYDVW